MRERNYHWTLLFHSGRKEVAPSESYRSSESTILFISLTLGIGAVTFGIGILMSLSGVLVLMQLLVIAIGGVLFPKISIKDREIKPSQIWLALDRIAAIKGIMSFGIDVILIQLKVSM